MSSPSSASASSPEMTDDQKMEQEEELREEELLKSEFPPFDPELILKCKNMSSAELRHIDQTIVEKGMHMFFNNQFAEAEALFKQHYTEDPLVANAYGTLATMRAMLSMEQQDVDLALKCLVYASHFGKLVMPQGPSVAQKLGSAAASVSRWWYGTKANKPVLTASAFRAQVVMAEAEVLRANLLILQDSFSSYIKAGLALRRSYNLYDALQKYMLHYDDGKEEGHNADVNSIEGMHFGLGCIHVVTSILPPKILTVLSALGYMHDREKGFYHLQHCLESRSLRAPIASLFMLAFHGMLPAFASLTKPVSIPFAEKVIVSTLEMFPSSVIHLWLAGRVSRLKRDTPESVRIFRACVENGTDSSLNTALPQLKHFALYDLAWSHCSVHEWEEARKCFEVLEVESVWSRMFYAYAQGCCHDALGQSVQASDCYERARLHKTIKLGGKTISVDQFVTRRLQLMKELSSGGDEKEGVVGSHHLRNTLPSSLVAIELTMLFNLFTQTPMSFLEKSLELVSAVEVTLPKSQYFKPDMVLATTPASLGEASPAATSAASPGSDDTEDRLGDVCERGDVIPIIWLMRGNILRELGRTAEAEMCYEALHHKRALQLQAETWVAPYAFYEHAVLAFEAKDNHKGRDMISKLKSRHGGTDYNFEMQMQFRLHLTNDVIKHFK